MDDIVETVNHFRCIDSIIDHATEKLTEGYIKELYLTLKTGTQDSLKDWFRVGEYKLLPNEVGGMDTCIPENVKNEMRALLTEYNSKKSKSFDDILDFHHRFESIHPFQDGNGRVGRLIMFKECLANGIVPFIITEELLRFYYRGLQQWPHISEYLRDTCLTAQDNYKAILEYFRKMYKPQKMPTYLRNTFLRSIIQNHNHNFNHNHNEKTPPNPPHPLPLALMSCPEC